MADARAEKCSRTAHITGSEMRTIITLIFGAIWWAPLAMAVTASKKSTVVETAPLKNMLGFFSMRAERGLGSGDAWALTGEHFTKPGDREHYLDRLTEVGGEYVFYPEVPNIQGVFVGSGGSVSSAVVGYQKERDYVSDVRYSSSERFDAWSSEERRLSARAFLGYRLKLQKFFTVSMRYGVDKVLIRSVRMVDEDIKSYGVEPQIEPRQSLEQSITLYAGLILR